MGRDRSGGFDGILVTAKPAGMTSHDVVGLVRRVAATRRVGHGGTLDPFATGVLPIFLGHATRLAGYHLGHDKTYRATVCFGASSTTDDLEGELTPIEGAAPTRAAVEGALPRFIGHIEQRPPAYSAIQLAGRRAYAMARAGATPELPLRSVVVHSVALQDWDGTDPARPIAVLEVACGAGTYMRALARDLGAAVGSAAYLGALTRTRSGSFSLDDAITLDRLRDAVAAGPDGIRPLLLPMDAGLEAWPSVSLTAPEVADIAMGRFVRPTVDRTDGDEPEDRSEHPPLRLLDAEGRLVALGRWEGRRLAPTRVLVDVRRAAEAAPTHAGAADTVDAAPSAADPAGEG
jgi:tRNA pseudouridine55 synthase